MKKRFELTWETTIDGRSPELLPPGDAGEGWKHSSLAQVAMFDIRRLKASFAGTQIVFESTFRVFRHYGTWAEMVALYDTPEPHAAPDENRPEYCLRRGVWRPRRKEFDPQNPKSGALAGCSCEMLFVAAEPPSFAELLEESYNLVSRGVVLKSEARSQLSKQEMYVSITKDFNVDIFYDPRTRRSQELETLIDRWFEASRAVNAKQTIPPDPDSKLRVSVRSSLTERIGRDDA